MCIGAPSLQAEGYPSRPIHIVVGFPAGGGADTVVRIISEALQDELGAPIVVDNRPGADGLVGTRSAAAARWIYAAGRKDATEEITLPKFKPRN